MIPKPIQPQREQGGSPASKNKAVPGTDRKMKEETEIKDATVTTMAVKTEVIDTLTGQELGNENGSLGPIDPALRAQDRADLGGATSATTKAPPRTGATEAGQDTHKEIAKGAGDILGALADPTDTTKAAARSSG
mmetsp:Transcript_5864/g.8995  ORF Transcript_5864/g.8995 Transcript_5864/m.8995 type:complete len:135 (+) Transcript_5864:866-1270(+)